MGIWRENVINSCIVILEIVLNCENAKKKNLYIYMCPKYDLIT